MMEIRYTLLSDGSSDRALIHVINWLLQTHLSHCAIQPQWADLRSLDKSLRDTFKKRIKLSLDLYPCDIYLSIVMQRERLIRLASMKFARLLIKLILLFLYQPFVLYQFA